MLSKSKYCAFSQCPKRLWLQTYHPELSEDNAALDSRISVVNKENGGIEVSIYDMLNEEFFENALSKKYFPEMGAPRSGERTQHKK